MIQIHSSLSNLFEIRNITMNIYTLYNHILSTAEVKKSAKKYRQHKLLIIVDNLYKNTSFSVLNTQYFVNNFESAFNYRIRK